MKKIITLIIVAMVCVAQLSAQEIKAEPATSKLFMQITTVESVVAGGMGRSRMLITNADGSQKESNLENLFSLGGINFKNIKENESGILKTLKSYTDEGWKLEQATSLTLSPSDNGGNGIFMTRYLLSMPDPKKAF